MGWPTDITNACALPRENQTYIYIYIYTFIWVRVALSWPPLMVWSRKYYNIGECSTSTTVSTSSISMYVIVYTSSTITNQQYSTITVWGRLENGRPQTNTVCICVYIYAYLCVYIYIQIIYVYVCNISILCDQTFTIMDENRLLVSQALTHDKDCVLLSRPIASHHCKGYKSCSCGGLAIFVPESACL